MVDNAEWQTGFTTRFGIQYVNYTTLERRYKRSAIALCEFCESSLRDTCDVNISLFPFK